MGDTAAISHYECHRWGPSRYLRVGHTVGGTSGSSRNDKSPSPLRVLYQTPTTHRSQDSRG